MVVGAGMDRIKLFGLFDENIGNDVGGGGTDGAIALVDVAKGKIDVLG